MLLLNKRNGSTVQGEITTDNPASSYGIPVLVIAGQAFGSAEVDNLKIVAATVDERKELAKGGYLLPDVPPMSERRGRMREK